MTPKEILKEAFDSDTEVLKKAFESDKELAEYINRRLTSIIVVLIQKGIITQEELVEIETAVETAQNTKERSNTDEH